MRSAQGTSRALAVAVVLGVLSSPRPARAEEPTAAPVPAPAIQHFVYGQGIALLMNRLSFGYDFLVGGRHSFGLNVFGQLIGVTHGGPNVASGTVGGVGGELGYRYYAGAGGFSGPFFGLAAIGGYYHSRADLYEADDNARFYIHYGGAIDMGWAFNLDKTTVVVLALGAQRTWVDERGHICDLAQLLVGDGVRPRAQIQVGRVFF